MASCLPTLFLLLLEVSAWVITHGNIRDRLHEFCAQAGLKPICKPRNLLRVRTTDTAGERRPDIALPGVDPLLLEDVTTTDAGCKTALNTHKSVAERGGAARGAETQIARASCPWLSKCRVDGDHVLSASLPR